MRWGGGVSAPGGRLRHTPLQSESTQSPARERGDGIAAAAALRQQRPALLACSDTSLSLTGWMSWKCDAQCALTRSDARAAEFMTSVSSTYLTGGRGAAKNGEGSTGAGVPARTSRAGRG